MILPQSPRLWFQQAAVALQRKNTSSASTLPLPDRFSAQWRGNLCLVPNKTKVTLCDPQQRPRQDTNCMDKQSLVSGDRNLTLLKSPDDFNSRSQPFENFPVTRIYDFLRNSWKQTTQFAVRDVTRETFCLLKIFLDTELSQ